MKGFWRRSLIEIRIFPDFSGYKRIHVGASIELLERPVEKFSTRFWRGDRRFELRLEIEELFRVLLTVPLVGL